MDGVNMDGVNSMDGVNMLGVMSLGAMAGENLFPVQHSTSSTWYSLQMSGSMNPHPNKNHSPHVAVSEISVSGLMIETTLLSLMMLSFPQTSHPTGSEHY